MVFQFQFQLQLCNFFSFQLSYSYCFSVSISVITFLTCSYIFLIEICISMWKVIAFSALTLLVGRQKKNEWWGAGVVICLERGADLHMAKLMPLPLTISCFSKIQIGFTFLVPADPGSPGKRTVKRVCVYVKGKHNHYTCITVLLHCYENWKKSSWN